MAGKDVYFVSKEDTLVKVDTDRLVQAIESKDKDGMRACEQTVCGDVETICQDAVTQTITALSPSGKLFDTRIPSAVLDLNTACVKLDGWTAVGRLNRHIVVAGVNMSNKSIEYVLVDAQLLSVINRVTVSKDFRADRPAIRHIRLLQAAGRTIVVGSRLFRYVDILQIVNDRLLTAGDSNTGIDVGGSDAKITSVACIALSSSVLIGGSKWMKRMDIRWQ